MKSILKIIGIVIVLIVIGTTILVYQKLNETDKTPHERFENLGYIVDLTDKTKVAEKSPTVILVSGSGGGFWGKKNKKHIIDLTENGYNVVRVGYLKIEGLPMSFERIEIGGFARIMTHLHQKYPQIDTSNIALVGVSKGAELALNVASRVAQYQAVAAIVPSFVTFQGREIGGEDEAYASFQLDGEELPFVPLPSSSFLGYETIWSRELDLFNAGLKNNPRRVEEARIPVEHINAPLLLISGKYDQIWPSFLMATEIEDRLEKKNYGYTIAHHAINTDHFVLRDDQVWETIMIFLQDHL